MKVGKTLNLKIGLVTLRIEYTDCFIGFDENLNRVTIPKLVSVK